MNAVSNSFYPAIEFCFSFGRGRIKTKYMNLSQQENSHSGTVNDQLREMISAYLHTHPGLTLNALAGRSGVPATTMRRLMQQTGSELAPHSVLSLVSYLLKEKKISSLLKKVEGPVAELLNKSFNQFIFDEESSDHEMHADLNTLFQDRTCYLIYKMAANACGTSVREIKNVFGLTGLQKLQEMVDKGVILNDDNERLHARDKNFSVDLALAHKLTHSLVDFYKPKDVEKGFNLFYSLSEGMSEEGIKRIKEIEINAVKKIFEIMNDEKNQGTIPYFAVVLSDVLGLTPEKASPAGVLQ
jgi:hypothetical protein